MRALPKYVKAQPDARGQVRYYFRYKGVYQRLSDGPESAEFHRRYAELLDSTKVTARTPEEGTVAAVIASYKANARSTPKRLAFNKLAPRTRHTYSKYLDRLAVIGQVQIADVERKHLKRLQDPLLKSPASAAHFAKVCSVLFAYAVEELELIDFNPCIKPGAQGRSGALQGLDGRGVRALRGIKPAAPAPDDLHAGQIHGPARGRHPQVDPQDLRWGEVHFPAIKNRPPEEIRHGRACAGTAQSLSYRGRLSGP